MRIGRAAVKPLPARHLTAAAGCGRTRTSHGHSRQKERDKQVVRGQPGSEITAMCYGEYFPNPGRLAAAEAAYDSNDHARLNALVPESAACGAE